MESALWTLLTGSSAVTALCGQRIYWDEAPQGGARPYVILQIISRTDHPHQQGTRGLETYRVQIDSYAVDRPKARELCKTIEALINGYRAGELRLCLLDTERIESGDGRLARASQDYIINWRAEHG